MVQNKLVKVTLLKSVIGLTKRQKSCVFGLGLKKIRQFSVLQDTVCVRGMINKVNHMLMVENVK